MSKILLSRRSVLANTFALGAVAVVGRGVAFAQQTSSTPAAGALDAATEAGWVKFNLNSASSDQYLTIPDMTDRMTREYDEYRPYTSILTFRKEIGKYVGDDVTAGYERYVFVPVDPTQADADTLQQLPGVSADDAATLAKGVPYADDNAFLAALAQVVSAEQAAWAPQFLASSAGVTATWVKYNLNTATNDQLLSIPAVTDTVAQAIAQDRPYATISQFRTAIGKSVDSSVVTGLEKDLFVPVDPARADADTLAQIPGVSADEASDLAKGVPYADANALLAAVAKVVSTDQATLTAVYVKSA